MATVLGWFGVRGAGASRVVAELRATCEVAAKADVPATFRVVEQAAWTIVVLDAGAAYAAPAWAQALSLRLARPAVAFFLLEGGWSYAVFEQGEELVAQEAYTLPEPKVYGDRARAAALFGIDAELFGRYERETDEWAHVDFAHHLGIEYPEEHEGLAYEPSAAERDAAATAWLGLPARLAMPEPPAHWAATGKEIDLDDFPTGDDAF